MTLEQAQQMDCPYKPRSVDLFTGQSLSKCTTLSCMCWVEITEPAYSDVKYFSGTYKDIDKFQQINPSYKCISTRFNYFNHNNDSNNTYTLGIPVTEPRGYCTLRGDI